MPLQFVIRTNKKAPARIGVLRAIIKEDKIAGYENLGTLKGFDEISLKKFTQEKSLDIKEQYQLENYVAHLTFNQASFNTPPEHLQRDFLYFSPVYEDALFQLWQIAKKHNISFCPAQIQQDALLHQAKAIERQLNKILKKPIDVLEKTGVIK